MAEADRVMRAAAEWVWVPKAARQLTTTDYRLIAYPEHFEMPTVVVSCIAERPAAELVDEVAEHVRGWGRETVFWKISAATRPVGLEAELAGRGAVVAEHVTVLACDLTAGLPNLGSPAAETELVRDVPGLRAWHSVADVVWRHGAVTPDEQIVEEAADPTPDGFRIVARLDGAPAAIGGCTVVDGVARLWGAASLPEARGRGAYRAVLAERLRRAREQGATLALVKGRVETSGPILRRAGFTAYGEERSFGLAAGPASA